MTASTPDPQESRPAASTTPAAPAASTAVTATPAKAAPPAPPAPRPAAPVKSAGGGAAGGAFVIAVVALLVAIGAIGVAVYSLKVARDALSKNADHAAAASATPSTATTQPVAAAPAPTVTATSTGTTPRAQYFPELVRAELKIPAPGGCNAAYVDVDTMAIGNALGHEFYLSTCVEPMSLRIDRTSGASSSSANPTADVCASLLSGTQTSQELVLTAKAGLTFCLLTNKADATAQNLPQRLAVVEVRDVAFDRTVTIAVSTYRLG